jgi:hypothetical protein
MDSIPSKATWRFDGSYCHCETAGWLLSETLRSTLEVQASSGFMAIRATVGLVDSLGFRSTRALSNSFLFIEAYQTKLLIDSDAFKSRL